MEEADFRELEAKLTPAQLQRRAWLIQTGKIFRYIFIFGAAIAIAFNIPSIGDRPLGSLKLNEVFYAACLAAMALGCVKWAFSGTTEEAAEAWGSAAIFLILALIGLAFFMNR